MMNELLSFVGIIIQTFGIMIPILFVLNELKRTRKQIFYSNIMSLEKEISEKTKDIWGIPENNHLSVDGKQIEIDLEKLQYMGVNSNLRNGSISSLIRRS